MRRILSSLGVVVLLFCIPVLADGPKMKDNPACENWHKMIGEWSWEMESKESPTAEWKKDPTAKYHFEWIMDGAFLRIKTESSNGYLSIETMGYDPQSKNHFDSKYDNSGNRTILNFGGWDGNIWFGSATTFKPDGSSRTWQCTIIHNSDFTSSSSKCQTFTDGKWWDSAKGKANKVK
jgi:hypothetical protein